MKPATIEGELKTEIDAMKTGERWGAYWKHPDGWMRLYPPSAESIREQAHTAQHADALHAEARAS